MYALLLSLVFAQDPAVSLPAEVKGKPGRFIYIQAQTKSTAQVRWYAFVKDADIAAVGPAKAVFVCPTPGRYFVICWSAVDGEPTEAATTIVIVGEPGPPDPPPQPDPDAQFKAVLRAAYSQDPDPKKNEYRGLLAQLYRQVGTAGIPANLTTAGQVLNFMRTARQQLFADHCLLPVRQAIEVELNKILPTNPMAQIDRQLAARTFLRIALALESIP